MFKKISKSSAFNIFIFTILIINIIIIIVNMTLVDPQTNEILDVIDNCCLGIYIIEFLIKIIGLGIARYFEDSWNV